MADVDEIWLEMQREQGGTTYPRKTKVQDLSLLQKEKTKAKRGAKRMDSSLNWMSSWSATLKPTEHQVEAFLGGPAMAVVEPPTTMVDALEELPTGTPEIFLAYIQRDINCLSEENLSVRLQSLQKLERVLVKQIDSLATDIVDAVVDALLKPLLKRMKDRSEKCRESAVKILRSLVENTSDLAAALPYIFPSLVARLGSEDLDGVAHLPEIMRPDPEQKPTEIAQPVEDSEEVRLQLGHFVASLLSRCSPTQIYSYIDEATGLIRAAAMDPFHEVKALACETMISFCYNHTEMLLHFALPLARSLTSCLTHNHAKLRIAGLRAVTACLWCGIWKHNFEIFQVLMAWQDPNKVPIKAFYEGVTNVNYMSTLSFDRHPAVRRFWFETLAYWMLRCVDKVDLEPYIAPYLLTGLCDENEEIALEVFWLIEKIGEAYEAEHEEDLRKTKQYGFDYQWTYNGRASVPFPLQGVWNGAGRSASSAVRRSGARGPDLLGQKALTDHHHRELLDEEEAEEEGPLGSPLELPRRDYGWNELRHLEVFRKLPRPRLGSRSWVRTHTRRYIKATFNDVVDFRDCTALNAGRLLCMSVAYTEEGVTEWLQPMLQALTKFYSGRAWAAGDTRAMQTYGAVCKLLGAFLEPAALWAQLRPALDADCALELDQRVASMRILAMCLEGHVAVLQSICPPDPSVRMGQLEPVIPELIEAMHNSDLLLSPTPESREVMWTVLFSFLEPLRPFLTEQQVSQLLFVSLALASKAAEPDNRKKQHNEPTTPELEADALLEDELDASLARALSLLSQGQQESLDSLDDDSEANPQERLFRRAFLQIMERSEESFQVFRSVLQLTPATVFLEVDHQPLVLERLTAFAGALSAPETRCSAQALGVQLALRSKDSKDFVWEVFQVLGAAQSSGRLQSLSSAVAMAGLGHWRRFWGDAGAASSALGGSSADAVDSTALDWMVSSLADQELYKKYHLAMEHAEKVLTGSDQEDWVLEKARYIRMESERRATLVRCSCASTALVALRARGVAPWGAAQGRGLLQRVASVLATAPHTMEPPFVKPTPPELLLYAAEFLHLLLHLADESEDEDGLASLPPFRLVDDAARAIHGLSAPSSPSRLPHGLRLSVQEEEKLVTDFIGAMLQLNLSLPPDPKAKFAPASLEDSAKDVLLGGAPTRSEVPRVLSQSADCLRWNAALALYVLGMDLAPLFKDAFQSCMARWQKRKEQAKVLLAQDVLQRAGVK
ncbi:Dynein axonemal assembly factor 5 (HEAT repeat-containing protein 2) [Durusdinium trenchii]|uniref:Dynein axonemal assembly factor 5 (HEAT repeat-containing protein 2) n=1 Tax=Durusdinium trenchii TaxID=1381693 RepID=A0ABP0JD43_9DINO